MYIFSYTSSSFWAGMGAIYVVLAETEINCPLSSDAQMTAIGAAAAAPTAEQAELAMAAVTTCDGTQSLKALGVSGNALDPLGGMVLLLLAQVLVSLALLYAMRPPSPKTKKAKSAVLPHGDRAREGPRGEAKQEEDLEAGDADLSLDSARFTSDGGPDDERTKPKRPRKPI